MDYRSEVLEDFYNWLGQHVVCTSQTTHELLVAVNDEGHPVSSVKGNGTFTWGNALAVYKKEQGIDVEDVSPDGVSPNWL